MNPKSTEEGWATLRWLEELAVYGEAICRFVEPVISPHRHALERGSSLAYEALRRFHPELSVNDNAPNRFGAVLPRGRHRASETITSLIEANRCSLGLVTTLASTVGSVTEKDTQDKLADERGTRTFVATRIEQGPLAEVK
jgi:hypothetical protein